MDKMKKILILIIIFMLITTISLASPLHDMQDKIGTDKFAHFGMGYVITDQLQRNVGMSTLEALMTTAFVAFAKEKWVDDTFTGEDITATVLGGLFYQIKF